MDLFWHAQAVARRVSGILNALIRLSLQMGSAAPRVWPLVSRSAKAASQ
jgi:hypothetical protein